MVALMFAQLGADVIDADQLARDVVEPANGQPVFVSSRDLPVRAGCYAEYIAVPADAAHPLPPGSSLEAAACLSNTRPKSRRKGRGRAS